MVTNILSTRRTFLSLGTHILSMGINFLSMVTDFWSMVMDVLPVGMEFLSMRTSFVCGRNDAHVVEGMAKECSVVGAWPRRHFSALPLGLLLWPRSTQPREPTHTWLAISSNTPSTRHLVTSSQQLLHILVYIFVEEGNNDMGFLSLVLSKIQRIIRPTKQAYRKPNLREPN